jgi:hypothetical protein
MKTFLTLILLLLQFSFYKLNAKENNYEILCKILSHEKVVQYLHLDDGKNIESIKIIDSLNFLKNKKEVYNCLGMSIEKVDLKSKTKQKLVLQIVKVAKTKRSLILKLKYEFEGISIKVELPNDKVAPMTVEIQEN